MTQHQYNKFNNLTGWFAFAIALITYALTIEPSSSFWDCGEYIATSVKLQVGHPPGAPLFQMLGAMINIFTHATTEYQAVFMNLLSGISSAFTVLFLTWTTSNIMRRFIVKSIDNIEQVYLILGTALVAGVTFTFTDTFWFNAVEAEVYAMASTFAALIFWLGFKWEADDSPTADRYLFLIAYCVGISIGVHMLAFIVIPSLAVIYQFKYKNHPDTIKQFIGKTHFKPFLVALFIGICILFFIFKFSLPWVFAIFNNLELFFVNSLGLPFHSGTIFSAILITAAAIGGISYFNKQLNAGHNTMKNRIGYYTVHCATFIILGFTSWLMLPIRSNAFTPINENMPTTAVSLTSYYNREQYGSMPLVSGPSYIAFQSQDALDPNKPYLDGSPIYAPDKSTGKYIVVNDRKGAIPNYKSEYTGLFPRMAHRDPNAYRQYAAKYPLEPGQKKPTLFQNISFFLQYQIGYMYLRYFGWNFIGRQNDSQGHMDPTNGNVSTGISFVDQNILSTVPTLEDNLGSEKSHNTYFALPFILGLIGLVYHYKKDYKSFIVVLLLHLLGGLGLVINTNMKLFEPRERDYIYIIAFMTYCIWIAMAIPFFVEQIRIKTKQKFMTAFAVSMSLVMICGPVLLGAQNWDDHDRSGRYATLELAKSYLEPTLPNSILFNMGDNDTFPLWYAQEIEQIRPDLKLINLSLFNTDWYVQAQQKNSYQAKAIPSQIEYEKYRAGKRDVIYYHMPNALKTRLGDNPVWTVQQLIDWIDSDHRRTKINTRSGSEQIYFPVKNIRIPVNIANVKKYNLVDSTDYDKIQPYIDITITKDYLEKKDMMILDILANFEWKRPIYFAISVGTAPSTFTFLHNHMRLDGMVYQLVPFRTDKANRDMGYINADRLHHNLTQKFSWINFNDKNIYFDETVRRNLFQYKNVATRALKELIAQGQLDKATDIADLVIQNCPFGNSMISEYDLAFMELLIKLKHPDSNKIFDDIVRYNVAYLKHLETLESVNIRQTLMQTNAVLKLMKSLSDKYNFRKGEIDKLMAAI